MGRKWIKRIMAGVMLCAIYLLSREGAVLTAQEKTESPGAIVIDSGHGGVDPGVVGIDGLEEKGINLKIAGFLGEYLEAEGYEVVFTREDDTGLYDEDSRNKKNQDLKNRCALIEETEPILTVSIHQNSYPRESICGSQVFYYQTSKEGKKLAEILQKRLSALRPDIPARQAKSNSSYYLLLHADPPAVIAECGFLSNWTEATLLASEEYQDQLAWALHMGILEYLNTRTPLNARAAAAGQGRCSTL